ncbi:MAG: pseudouridine synthase [Candidatus Saccharibacteria bacterium]|nr:pseudouridine synthase [Candidatus Saccharibacteria bacterium]
MRINKFVAQATGLSRRAADQAVAAQRVTINGVAAEMGSSVADTDTVNLDGQPLVTTQTRTILLHKPVGFVVSRDGQGSRTVYDLLPTDLHDLKPVGRLDKDSSGLLLLTNDGDLANRLTHPSRQKRKVYEVTLDTPLQPLHRQMIAEHGLQLEDGPSKLGLERQHDGDDTAWIVAMHEGRNRQIRRTFAALGYTVTRLHRTQFGEYRLDQQKTGTFRHL